MIPELLPVTSVKVNWPVLRKTVSQVTGLQPSSQVASSPIQFSEPAEFLLFAAYLSNITGDPHNVLLTLPRECMNFLHYTFLIACDEDTTRDLRERTRAHYTMTDVRNGYCILGTGPLSVWHDAVVLNLTHPRSLVAGTRILLDKLLLFFEREGLHALFPNKKSLEDGTFLLEK